MNRVVSYLGPTTRVFKPGPIWGLTPKEYTSTRVSPSLCPKEYMCSKVGLTEDRLSLKMSKL